MAATEEESMVAARERRCTYRNCECCWLYLPEIPRIAPGSDYNRIPAGADQLPAWSLLVGVIDGKSSSIRVSRLRVARSGRILGRSDDKLEVFHDIVLGKPPADSFEAGAALAPDGRSLCVLRKDDGELSQALQLSLQLDTEESVEELPLPEIEGTIPCIPISAADQIWAMSATVQVDMFRVVTRRLVPEPDGRKRWEQVGEPFTSPLIHHRFPAWGGWFLQGYPVLPGAKLILVSFQQYGLFLTFAPHSRCWTQVHTDQKRSEDYLPIKGRAIYMEQRNAVYMLWENTIYAYKLNYEEDAQGTKVLKLDPPIEVDLVCPFTLEKGYGFLTRLTDRLLCSVWISLAMRDRDRCPCDHLHAIVTTFHPCDLAHGGIDVLYSTYRRVNMAPSRHQEFCFLQEYEDEGSLALLPREEEQEDSSQHVNEPSKLLACCRSRRESLLLTLRCFECGSEGHFGWQCTEKREMTIPTIPVLEPSRSFQADPSSRELKVPSSSSVVTVNPAIKKDLPRTKYTHASRERTISTIPPSGQTRSIPADPSSRQLEVPSSSPVVTVNPATTAIKKDLIIICQAGSQSVISQMGAMDDDGKPVQPCYVVDDGDHCYFFKNGSKIYAVPGIRDIPGISDDMLEFSMNKDCTTIKRPVRRPTADPFIMVIRVGGETIAVTDTLRVFNQTKYTGAATSWLPYKIKRDVVCRNVSISGYVVVNDDSFIVCDSVTSLCFLLDMAAKQWRVVMPWAAFEEDLPRTNGILNGRCLFVDGFIYTRRNGGLAAYELVSEGGCVFIGKPIFLPFSWQADCVGENMCLDYAGKDKDPAAILFYLVQGGCSPPKHAVQITTVKVKTKRVAGKKMIPAGIDRVGSVMRFIRIKKAVDKKAFDARCCFAL